MTIAAGLLPPRWRITAVTPLKSLLRSGRRLVDQSPQCQAHRVVEIAIDKATAAELQPSNHTFKIDAVLFRR
jgi:hypothetical protein